MKTINDNELVKKNLLKGTFDDLFEVKGNNSFQVFRKTALLCADNITAADILKKFGINEVYIYGFGEIGTMLYKQLNGHIKIAGIIDGKKAKMECFYEGIDILAPENISENDIPIMITPASSVQDIIYSLIKKGIKRERLISYNVLLELGMHTYKNNEIMDFRKQFLITGAQFENKGAQAMLFVAVSEIRRRYPDAIIWYVPVWDSGIYTKEVQERYRMLFLLDGIHVRSQMFELLPLLTAIVDVSGYAFSSHWENIWYYTTIRAAYYYDIPLFMMPQSYGPFDFAEETQEELTKILPHVEVMYAREQEGFDLLNKTYGLSNVRLSKDLVLQNKKLYLSNIYTSKEKCREYSLDTKNNVAIVPNVRTYEFGNKGQVLELYESIIQYLLNKNKTIYIIPHCDDQEICNDIYQSFQDDERVYLYDNLQDCIEYSMLIKNFQYVIASRYHAIIHAYKEGIPVIAIGWAEKYKVLLNDFQQAAYMFDVRNGIEKAKVLAAIQKLDESFEEESQVIKTLLPNYQNENCFDVLSLIK